MNAKDISPKKICGGLLIALIWSLHSHAATLKDEQELAGANSSFAFNLLQQLAQEQPQSNIFISPYSASTALQMVSTGAAGATLVQMQEALGTVALQTPALAEGNKQLGGIINAHNTNFTLTTANALWYRAGLPVLPSFLARDEQFFGAQVASLNFDLESSVKAMNAWASKETHGKIDQIVSGPIDPNIRMYLANAVYFLGTWQSSFDTNLTANGPFQLSGGGQTNVPMMNKSAVFNYTEAGGYQAVRLPYKGSNLAMYVFLPSAESSVQELLASMDYSWWQQTAASAFAPLEGTLTLPKFKLNYSASLVPALQSLGMTDAFTLAADFSKISAQPLFISEVQQQAIVDVNEVGTEAAAVTTVGMTAEGIAGPPPDAFEMIVNRPFLFLIEDEPAQTILFMGLVLSP